MSENGGHEGLLIKGSREEERERRDREREF